MYLYIKWRRNFIDAIKISNSGGLRKRYREGEEKLCRWVYRPGFREPSPPMQEIKLGMDRLGLCASLPINHLVSSPFEL